MKKMKNITKTLSEKETKQIRGGGWMDGFDGSQYSSRRERRRARRAWMAENGGCPPPDPTGE